MNENFIYSANAIPITPANKLRLLFSNANPGANYDVLIRWQVENKDGTISDNAELVTVQTGAQQQTVSYPLPYGNLLAVSLCVIDTLLQNGNLFGVIQLQYGSNATARNILPLTSGYIGGNAPLNYPLSQPQTVNSGLPSSLLITYSTPGGGNELNLNFSPTGFSKINVGSFTFTASATVANRTITTKLNTNGNPLWSIQHATAVSAGQTVRFFFCDTPPPTVVPTGVQYIQLPRMTPVFNLNLTTETANIDGGDEFNDIVITHDQYVFT